MGDKRKEWQSFYFEGNQAWGWIKSEEDWERIKKAYEDSDINLFNARNNPNRYEAFGLYYEYTGDTTLGEHCIKNNMDIGYNENGRKD